MRAESPGRRFLFNLDLWVSARLLPWRIWRMGEAPFADLLKLAEPGPARRYEGLAPDYVAARVERTLRRPWLMRDRRCLRQGLLGFRFLNAAGHEPRLHFGVDPASVETSRLSAHCWVELNGQTLIGASPRPLVTVLSHPARRDSEDAAP